MGLLFSLPNLLSFLRILLTPVFILFLTNGGIYLPFSILVFTVAAITDYYDGYYARRLGLQSRYGMFLDPLADKVLVLSTFIAFYMFSIIDFWMVVVIIVRDVIVTSLRILSLVRGVTFKTSVLAKWKTASQFLLIYVILGFIGFNYFHGINRIQDMVFRESFVFSTLLYFVVLLIVYSGGCYLVSNIEIVMVELRKISLKNICKFISTLGFIGYTPKAPGTVGSAVAAVLFFFLPEMSIFAYIALLVGLFAVGFISCFFNGFEQKDPSWVIIDEMVGMGVALLGLPKLIWVYVLAFVFFRFFDIVKPYPINKLQDFPGAFGILLDDVLAGVVTLILVQLIWPFF